MNFVANQESGMTGKMTQEPKQVYLDYNATTPVDPQVVEAMLPYLQGGHAFGNPSRSHWAGRPAKQAIVKATEQVAQLIGAEPDEIVITSGGSESVNHAIQGNCLPFFKQGYRRRVITSQIEHPSSKMACRFLESYFDAPLTEVGVDVDGVVDVAAIRAAAGPNTALINIMHASHEIGTRQPVEAIAETAREHDIPFHVDAVCSVGKNVVNVKKIGCDLLSLSGHKFYAPKGIGALYVSRKMRGGWPGLAPGNGFQPLIQGMLARGTYRPGTPNVAAIVGLGKAAELACVWNTPENRAELAAKRDYLWSRLQEAFGARVTLNAHEDAEKRVANCLNVSFAGQDGEELLAKLDHLAASSGPKTEDVVRAIGRPAALARGAIRFSLGKMTTYQELDNAVTQFSAELQ